MKLEIKNLSKRYSGEVCALSNVNLSISKGMFGLLGANGAGKSTLMRTIATLQEADKGEIRLDNIDVVKNKHEARKLLGYLPQDFGLYPQETPENLLKQIAYLKGIKGKKERKALVSYYLDKVNLYKVRNQKLGGFSGGMTRRFGIAQALIGNPKLIIVDEPTAGLDPEEKTNFYNILSEASEKAIVILSTHIVEDIHRLCNDMAIISGGKVVEQGNPSQLLTPLNDKIWRKKVTKKEFENLKETQNVIRYELISGEILAYIYSNDIPGDGFEHVVPVLEDLFFIKRK
ncbi:ABC transporter ATP-binding protein [Seonamhaeicola marinus]|uniref:ABC transporter ATP-binding protein n=1 Tax=Seonamhaeicola marinus TaxID=1912246 RepID=A0A5D0HQQ7_9FLAO|nr:ABC transporter ATP-binding protein [Seonamhaeicola marinus]TYA71712.1 ABC transporter ATP-binding protein [Seonamhaeicola marinus]